MNSTAPSFHPPEMESVILSKVVHTLEFLKIRQRLCPQDTLLEVTKKLGRKDPLYVTKKAMNAPGSYKCQDERFLVTCIVGIIQVLGESCEESRATELAACTMLVRILLKEDLNRDNHSEASSEASGSDYSASEIIWENSGKQFRYLNLGFRLDSRNNFRSIETLQIPLVDDPPRKVIKICNKSKEGEKKSILTLPTEEFRSKYEMARRIETGSFGVVMMGKDLKTEELVALKFEAGTNRHPKLLYEQEATRRLSAGGANVPAVLDFFRYKTHLVMVMPFLGPSLEMMCKRFPFSTETVRKLGYQMIRCVESVHRLGFIHRDIKPSNFVLDYDQKVWTIDLGLSKPFGNEDKARIYTPLDPRLKIPDLHLSRVGTRRWCTLRSHSGVDQNFQDDLIALGYTLAFFLKGQLPWQNLKSEGEVQLMKSKMEGNNYLDLCHDLSSRAQEMLKNYFSSVLNNPSEVYHFRNYSNLQEIFQPPHTDHQPVPFEWEY